MTIAYEKAIYLELGEDIEKQLKYTGCTFVVNYDDLTYTFSGCPRHLLDKILELKDTKGANSLLREFNPSAT